jgi:tripartite-type tricarboxylate transporter receptor subunit TctC
MIDRRRFIAMSALALAAAALPRAACSQATRKLARLVVGFPPGGSLDVVARLLTEQLKGYADSVIVENRPGAGGRIALEGLRNSPPDGSLMVLTPGDQLSLFPLVYKSLAYDPFKDFVPVSTVCTVQFLLTIGPMVPTSVDTLQSFIAWCHANPKLASYGTAGAGTRQHFIGESFSRAAGFEFVHVPYKGAPPAMQDLLAGQIAANVSVISTALPSIEAGKVRALLTSAPRRSAALPQVPTAREAGYAALEAVETFGLLLARGTPQVTVDALNAATRRAIASATAREGLTKLSFEPAGSTPEEFAALIKFDFERWSGVVRTSGFKSID